MLLLIDFGNPIDLFLHEMFVILKFILFFFLYLVASLFDVGHPKHLLSLRFLIFLLVILFFILIQIEYDHVLITLLWLNNPFGFSWIHPWAHNCLFFRCLPWSILHILLYEIFIYWFFSYFMRFYLLVLRFCLFVGDDANEIVVKVFLFGIGVPTAMENWIVLYSSWLWWITL